MKKCILSAMALCVLAACSPTQSPVSTQSQISTHQAMTHTIESQYPFSDTVSRLKNAFESKGMTIFATIDHQAAAQQANLTMQPATVIIFGTPKAGTPLMIKSPELALQLPLRVLITEIDGKVKVVYNDTHAVIHGSQITYSEVANTLANAEKLIQATVTQ